MARSALASIFTRPAFFKEITETHQAVYQNHRHYFDKIELVHPGLIDFLVCPVSRNLTINRVQHDAIVRWLKDPKAGPVNQFQVYSQIEISVMESRWKFVQACPSWFDLHNPEPHPLSLSEVSLKADSPSMLLAIKYFFLYLSGHAAHFEFHHGLEYAEKFSLKNYIGLQPNTSPVKWATWVLWGTEMKNFVEAKNLAANLAHETGLSEIEVNTGLWLLGQRMKNSA